MAAFSPLALLFILFFVWEHVHMCLGLDNWMCGWHKRALLPRSRTEQRPRIHLSNLLLIG